MTTSETEIRALIASRPCSATAIPALEAYLNSMASSATAPYIFDAVRLLIKLYGLFPDYKNNSNNSSRQQHIGQALLLALVQYPNSTDYLALTYMIPSNILNQVDSPASKIQACADLLDACQYTEFWKLYHDTLAGNELASRSVAQLQSGIVTALSWTYKEAPLTEVVLPALGVKDAASSDVNSLLKNHPGVESVTASTVVFRSSTDNSKRDQVFQESVGFAAICSTLSQLAQ